jgi:hypothetical protein
MSATTVIPAPRSLPSRFVTALSVALAAIALAVSLLAYTARGATTTEVVRQAPPASVTPGDGGTSGGGQAGPVTGTCFRGPC